jgi:catechol 2,3-dioxygenase-like lactoylglutathione lyase family enzyme
MWPFFIVSSVEQSIAFYQEKLGFEIEFKQPDEHRFSRLSVATLRCSTLMAFRLTPT